MWRGSRHSQPSQCSSSSSSTMDSPIPSSSSTTPRCFSAGHHHHVQQHRHLHHNQPDVGMYGGATPPHMRRALLQFPPPPNYPPPYPSTSKMSSEEHLLALSGQAETLSLDHQNHHLPITDYSYAYYVPGPPTKHTNVPSKYPGTYREGTYKTRHTYVTRYGTEENIYEEISEVARARLRQDSIMSLNQSIVEEEVRRVQSGHRRVLGELNLSVEAMLMPSSSREGSDDTDRETEVDDQLPELLTVGPTDDLLSPAPIVDHDSGFSGSSSGASYRSAAGSLRRGPPDRHYLKGDSATTSQSEYSPGGGRSFWGKKAWKKLTGFPSNISLNKHKAQAR